MTLTYGVWALRDIIAECMPILTCHKWRNRHDASVDQNILPYAEFKEESHAIIRSTGHSKADMIYIVLCAPLFVDCCVESVPETKIIAERMPILKCPKWWDCHRAPMDQNILRHAEFKEELHAIIRSTGHGKATMKYIAFHAPFLLIVALKEYQKGTDNFKFWSNTKTHLSCRLMQDRRILCTVL